jgi:hypothetical protein
MLPLRRMVAHQNALQRVRSTSLPKFVKETLARFGIGFPQGMGKVGLLPMGYRRQIRDGPLRRQQRLDRLHLDRLHRDTKREAA